MPVIQVAIDERQHLRLLRLANDEGLTVEEVLQNLAKKELDRYFSKKEQK
jgi:hypothetical protein